MNLVMAEFGLGEALLTVLAIFFAVVWIWVMITVIIDLFRDRELSGVKKAIWLFFLLVLTVPTALVYLVARGNGMRDRAVAEQRELQKATDAYIREAAGTSPADQIAKLNDLKSSGAISEEEFQTLKARAIAQ